MQLVNLIVHKSYQRGYDNRNKIVLFGKIDRRNLEKNRLSRTSRCSYKYIAEYISILGSFTLIYDFSDNLPLGYYFCFL